VTWSQATNTTTDFEPNCQGISLTDSPNISRKRTLALFWNRKAVLGSLGEDIPELEEFPIPCNPGKAPPLQAYRARSRECIPANEAGLWRAPDRDGAVTLILQRISNIHQFFLSLSNSQFSGLQRPPLSPSAELWLRICQSFELPNQATRKLFVHHITSHHIILHVNRTATSQRPRGQPGTWRARVSSSSSCSSAGARSSIGWRWSSRVAQNARVLYCNKIEAISSLSSKCHRTTRVYDWFRQVP
jgi:hypothetical protein